MLVDCSGAPFQPCLANGLMGIINPLQRALEQPILEIKIRSKIRLNLLVR